MLAYLCYQTYTEYGILEIIYSWASHNALEFWQIRFIDNTDPAGIDHQIAQLGPELASTLVIVISKVCM
jgi:glucose-6-phosphate isomerase